MATNRAKRKLEIAARAARQAAERERSVKARVYGVLAWILMRTLEGGLPELGKVLFRIGAGGLVALVARWFYGA